MRRDGGMVISIHTHKTRMDHYMIRQELNPETCRLDMKQTKLTMHPTNNRSSPEWFPCPRSSSKINRRRGFEEIPQIHRRQVRRNNPENQNTIGHMVFGENTEEGFWCSRTNRKWPNLIPDCDNSAVNWSFKWTTSWRFLVEPLPISEKETNIVGRYVKGTSPLDITVTSGRLRWHRNQSHTCAPCY